MSEALPVDAVALPVDAVALRDEVRAKYRDVAVNPRGGFHFHTGRPVALKPE